MPLYFRLMKIQLWSVGKAHDKLIKAAIDDFTTRIGNYFMCEWVIIPPVKNASSLSEDELKKLEGKAISNRLEAGDFLVLLDETGNMIANPALAHLIRTKAERGTKKMIFLIGGAFGVGESIKARADFIWSISPLVFPHMLVRLILSEQIYRSCTILRNEKYHHI